MSASKILFRLSISFIFGIFLASFFQIPLILILGFLILGIFFIIVFNQYKNFFIFGIFILFFVFGIFRYQKVLSRIEASEMKNFWGKEVDWVGILESEPEVRETTTILKIKTEKGKILVTTRRYPEYRYGDKLKISGKLKEPPVFEGFNYKNYLLKDGILGVMAFPKIEFIERGKGNPFYAKIFSLKNKLRETIEQNLSPPQSSLLKAMILGEKAGLSAELKEKLNIVGLRHITAISGLHITLLSTILMNFLIGLGLWRKEAFYFTIIFLFLFIIMTGLQPSAIRAGIMTGFFLLAQYLGRVNTSSLTIVYAAFLMLFFNPLLLKLDVGFQLSFLAMLGIIYLSPIFQNWLKKIPNPFQLRNILAMTLGAQLFTLPILIYNFGYLSLVSLITNLLVVPFLYWVMLFAFLFSFLGLILSPLAWLFSFPLWFLLTFILWTVDFFSKLPFAFTLMKISLPWLIISYLILGLITWRLQKNYRTQFLPP